MASLYWDAPQVSEQLCSSKLHINMTTTHQMTWWRHQMETFSALLALCVGNSPVPVNSPQKCQCRGTLMFSFICVWINGWVNNREAGNLRRYRAHYNVTVMESLVVIAFLTNGHRYSGPHKLVFNYMIKVPIFRLYPSLIILLTQYYYLDLNGPFY